MPRLSVTSPLTEAMVRYEAQSGRKYRNGSSSCRVFDRLMGVHPVESITWETLRDFVILLKAKGIAQTTIGRYVGDVKTVVYFITGKRLLPPVSPTPDDPADANMETISVSRWSVKYCAGQEIVRRGPIHSANRFVKHMGNMPVSKITTNLLIQFRKSCVAEGLAPMTIETNISDLQTLVKAATENVLSPGRRCIIPRPRPRPVTLETITAMWPYCDTRLRQWIVVTYWTALRLSDSMNLMTSLTTKVPDVLEWQASKTKHVHQWPVLPWLHPFLIRRKLPFKRATNHAVRSIRKSIRIVCDAAGVDHWHPKNLRQLSLSQWLRADPVAGQIVHGCGLNGVLKHYIDPMTVLVAAAPRIPVPDCFTTNTLTVLPEPELTSLFSNLEESQQLLIRQTMRTMLNQPKQ